MKGMVKMVWLGLLFTALCFSPGLAGAQSIVIALGSEPTTLDPQLREDGGERAVNDNIYETLLRRTPEGELAPGLAAEMPALVDPDTWEVRLRSGIRFHNGEPFNADAAVFSIKRIIGPLLNSEQISFFNTIRDAVKVDENRVRIMTKGPDPILPSRLYWLKMVPPAHSKDVDFVQTPSGTGPYKFVEWKRGHDIVLERHEGYWGDAPQIQKVTYRFVSEPDARLAGLLAGEFDLITNLLPEFTPLAPQFIHILGLEHPIIILHADGGPTKDVRVRKALNLAVDKTALAEGLFEGFAQVAQGQLLSPSFFGFSRDVKPYPYDPDQARALLKQAGAEGASVELIGPAGRWLKDRELIESVAAYWEDVGLKPRVRIFEFNEYLNRLFDRKIRSDAVFVVSSNELLDADKSFSAYYQAGGMGASNTDPELAEMITRARTETDAVKRLDLYHQAIQRAYDNAYFVWLLNIEDIYGLSKRLQWKGRVDAKLLVSEMRVER